MKNHLDNVFKALSKKKRKALIFYVTAGYPSFKEQEKILKVLDEEGVDIFEIGVPFSDPVADGPTIQFSSQESLKKGTNLKGILRWAKKIRPKVKAAFVIMSYINPILTYGLNQFGRDAKKAGITGIVIPDLIPEEAVEIKNTLSKYGVHLIYLVSPTTPSKRQKFIAGQTKGFLYSVSVTGVTGARKKTSSKTKPWLQHLRRITKAPVCVGFGISGPKQVRLLRNSVDGFIVGSALIDLIRNNKNSNRLKKIRRFTNQLSKECSYAR